MATQLYLTPLVSPVYLPHPDSLVCLFTQRTESQTAVGQKHTVRRERAKGERERDREEKLIALVEQLLGGTEHF